MPDRNTYPKGSKQKNYQSRVSHFFKPNEISFKVRQIHGEIHVPEVLNVHLNESKKKSTFFRRIFFSSSKKLTFDKENVIFLILI